MANAGGSFQEPYGGGEQAASPVAVPPPLPTGPIDEAIERHRPKLLRMDGVIGVAHGQASTGGDAVVVHVLDDSVQMPKEIDGFPVEVVVIKGGFHAQDVGPVP